MCWTAIILRYRFAVEFKTFPYKVQYVWAISFQFPGP